MKESIALPHMFIEDEPCPIRGALQVLKKLLLEGDIIITMDGDGKIDLIIFSKPSLADASEGFDFVILL